MVVLVSALPYYKHAAVRWLMLLTFSFCTISFCTLNTYIVKDFDLTVLFSRSRFLGFALLGPSWLMFMSVIFQKWAWLSRKWVTAIIFTPALLTIIISMTPSLAHLHVTDFAPFVVQDISVVSFKQGPWFKYYILWSYFLTMAAFVLGFFIFKNGSWHKRRQASVLMLGSALSVSVDIYCIATNSPLRWLTITSITFLFTQMGVIYATFRYRLLEITPFALNKIFNTLPDPILITDAEGNIQDANTSAQKIFELPQNFINHKWTKFFPGMEFNKLDYQHISRQGDLKYFQFAIEQLKNANEEVAGRIVYFHEITRQKEVEKSLNMNLEFKTRLLSLIAHDLSASIENQIQITSSLTPQDQDLFEKKITLLTSSAFSSQDIIANIIGWAKMQKEGFKPVLRQYEVNALIRECVENTEASFQLKNVEAIFESQIKSLIVLGDSVMMASVVRNLLMNALRASSSSKKINIQLKVEENFFEIAIKDEGVGMSKEHLQVLQQPQDHFSPVTAFPTEGFGIGLTIVRHFVELHGGHLHIDSKLGVGTCVRANLPL